jgi:hypothetical protein
MNTAPVTRRTPRVIYWYTAYRIVLLLFTLAILAAGFVFLVYPEWILGPNAGTAFGLRIDLLVSSIYLSMGGAGAVLLVISFLLPRSRTAYAYHLMIIGVGSLAGAIGILTVIPLVYFWLRPEVQAYYGWSTELDQPHQHEATD